MKELERTLEQAFVAIPEKFRDWLTIKYATFWWQFGVGHSFKTGRSRYWGHRMLEKWYKGESTPLSVWATKLFDAEDFNIQSAEFLGEEKAAIIVINQPNEGPLWGGWFKFALNYAVAEQRGRVGNFEARWVQGEISQKAIWKSPLAIQRRRLSEMVHKSCNTILVDQTASNREKAQSVLEMRDHLKAGGALVICPEGKDSPVLSRAKVQAGELVLLLASKLQVPILPAAVFFDRGSLNLNFGRVLEIEELVGSQLFRGQADQGQRIGDLLMVEIGKLLPAEKRGVYSKVIRQVASRQEAIAA